MPRQERDPLLPSAEAVEDDVSIPSLYKMSTARDQVFVAFVYIGLLMFVPSTWYLVLSNEPGKLGYFAPHPILQSLGITTLLMGIIPLQTPPPATSKSPSSPIRKNRIANHQRWILGLTLPIFALGAASMWWNKHIHGAQHFTTWHGKLGLLAAIWMVSQALVGGLSVWFGGAAFGGSSAATKVFKYHRLSGTLLLPVLLFTAHLGGGHSDWALGHSGRGLRIVAFWIGLMLVLVGWAGRVRPGKMKIF